MHIEQIDLGNNYVRTCIQDSKTLVVSFDMGGRPRKPNPKRPGFAQKFLLQQGFDAMFVMPKTYDWYQTPELAEFFKILRKTGFLSGYERIITYGSSMGGFAAIAFSALVCATDVIALQPRTTLHDRQAKWFSAYSEKMNINRSGQLADALRGLMRTARITVFFDPFHKRDARHARRILAKSQSARLMKVPFIGHQVPYFFSQAGILKSVFKMSLEPEFDEAGYYRLIRVRKTRPGYIKKLTAIAQRRRSIG